MTQVHLYGALGSRYGGPFQLDVTSPAEAVRALGTQLDGFFDMIRAGVFRLVRGDLEDGFELGEDELHFGLGDRDLHIVPVPAGAKNSGVGKIIIGVIIAVAAIATAGAAAAAAGTLLATELGVTAFLGMSYGHIALLGAMMAFGGISQMMSSPPKIGDYGQFDRPEQRPSFLFSGAVNASHQGAAVPLVYGQMRVGSVVTSSGLAAEATA